MICLIDKWPVTKGLQACAEAANRRLGRAAFALACC